MVGRSETDLYFSAGQTIPHGVTSGIGVWFRSKASSFTRRMRKLEAGWLGFSCGTSSDTYKKGELLSGTIYLSGGGWNGSKFPDQMIWMVGQCTGAVAAPVL